MNFSLGSFLQLGFTNRSVYVDEQAFSLISIGQKHSSVFKTKPILMHFRFKSRLFMPSPSASSKFGSSILKFFKHAHFFMYTQNHFGILKS